MKLTLTVLTITLCSSFVIAQDVNINNQASATINADSGSSGNGEVKIQTKNEDRITVLNNGNVVLGGGTSDGSRMFFNTPCVKPLTGLGRYCTDRLITFGNNDLGFPDWQVLLGHSFQDNAPASARPFHSLTLGFNADSNMPDDHGVGFNIETPYISGVGIEQAEVYFWFNGRPGVVTNPANVRPIGFDAHLATNQIQIGLRSNITFIGYQGYSNDWLALSSTPTQGEMTFNGNSGIRFNGSREWLIQKVGGVHMMGINGRVVQISSGGGFSEEVNFFKLSSATNPGMLTFTVGGNPAKQGWRWNGVDTWRGWEFQHVNQSWYSIGARVGSDSTLQLWNGSAFVPVELGEENSCGLGRRCVTVPN